MRTIFLFILLISSFTARASIPPAHYIAKEVSGMKANIKTAIVNLSFYRPVDDNFDETKSIGIGQIVFPQIIKKNKEASDSPWPLLSIWLEPDAENLRNTWLEFGVNAPAEQALVIKNTSENTGEAPTSPSSEPFYQINPQLHLHRINKSILWEIANADRTRALLFMKDSFLPYGMQAPCPRDLTDLSWAKGGKNCTVNFEYQSTKFSGLKIPAKTMIYEDNRPLLLIKIDHIIINPSNTTLKSAETSLPEKLTFLQKTFFH